MSVQQTAEMNPSQERTSWQAGTDREEKGKDVTCEPLDLIVLDFTVLYSHMVCRAPVYIVVTVWW